MNDWRKYKLGDIGKIARGKSKHRPRYASFLYGGPYPFLQTGDVKNANHKIHHYTQTYSEEGLAQSKLWPKGTLCITIAANIADTGILTFPACFPDSVIGFLPDADKCNIDYIEYLLQFYKRQIQTHAIGSVQDNINLGTFKNVEFPIPPLPTQHRIAEILGALDDKIELNLEMNKTLEELAMAIYKEWFVDFGPFRDGEFVDSELGSIPKGWEVKGLNHISIILDKIRKPISSRERLKISGNYPYYGATGILDWINDYKYDGRYVLMAEDGTVMTKDQKPYLQYIEGKFWVSNHAHVLKGKDYYSNTFLYHSLSNLYVVPYVTGAVQLKISRRNMDLMKFVTSSRELHTRFDAIVNPLIEQIFTNKSETETLKELRDFLLPKLISGEVRVKAAEEKLKEVL